MLNANDIDSIARTFHTAEKTRKRTRAASVLYPNFTVEDAYAEQRRWIELKVEEGNVIKGRKIRTDVARDAAGFQTSMNPTTARSWPTCSMQRR